MFGSIKVSADRRQHVKKFGEKIASGPRLDTIDIYSSWNREIAAQLIYAGTDGKESLHSGNLATYVYASRRGEYEPTPAVIFEAPLKVMLPSWHGGSTATPL